MMLDGKLYNGASGNSANVVNTAMIVKVKEMSIIGLVGAGKCKPDKIAYTVMHVSKSEPFNIQELYLPIYHYPCAKCRRKLFKN